MEDLQQKVIVSSAAALFQKYGIKKATMEDIALGAGMGKSTLYYYFKNKDAVYETVLSHELEEFKEIIRCAMSDYHSPEQSVTIFIKSVFSRIVGFPNLLSALLDVTMSDKASIIIQEFEQWQSIQIEQLLINGIRSGEFREMHDNELKINCQAIAIAMFGLRGILINENDRESFENKIDSLIYLLLHGIGKS